MPPIVARTCITLAAACTALAASAGPPDTVPAPVRELQRAALSDQRAMANLRSLTTEVGNRFAGSTGDGKAVAWALRTMREQGFANVHAEPVTVPRWVRGAATVQLLGDPPQDLATLALGGSVGTDSGPVEAEVVAATDVEELQGLGRDRVAGRIVFLYDRMIATRDGMDYGPTVRNRTSGAIEAARLGAVGLVIRAIGSEDDDRPHTGGLRYADGVPRIPALAVGNASADRLLERYARGPVRLRIASASACRGTAESANVIGEIPGRAAAQPGAAEYVLLGAHLDSWDVGDGAQDDGAGVATVLEAARRIGELPQRPVRTIRVVLFANEEFGLSGGKRYAIEHEGELARHAAALEADLGAGRVFRYESRVRPEDAPAAMRIAALLAPLGVPFTSNAIGGGADLGPVHDRGVPVFALQHDASQYFEIHHTAADRIDRVEPQDLAFNVAAYATLAWALAEQPARFQPLGRTWPAPPQGGHPCDWQP